MTMTRPVLFLANVAESEAPELVAGLSDGRFFFYDPATRSELVSIRPVTALNDFRVVDLTEDGVGELVVVSSSDLKVLDGAGKLLWSLTGPSGTDLVIAQMDADASLEIATTSGHVVDVDTRTIQWHHTGRFGRHLRAHDVDADGQAELIVAEAWYYIHAYNVDQQTIHWSYRTSVDISSIEIANVDAAPAPELLYADHQFGFMYALSLGLTPPVELWRVRNPDSGVARMIVSDPDDDGVDELIWGSGSNSSGPAYLNIHDVVTLGQEWRNIALTGPFLSPALGDVTGDGVPELVTAAAESRAGYGSGQILVFDAETLRLVGISPPVFQERGEQGIQCLVLRDVDGDGRLEIAISGDRSYDGIIEIYRFTDERTFEVIWTNSVRPRLSLYTQVDVLDADGDGDLEVVATSARAGSSDNHVAVIDYATNTQEWQTPHLGSSGLGVHSMAIGDLDGDGQLEVVAVVPGESLHVFDLVSRTREFMSAGNYQSVAVRSGQTGFIVGGVNGQVTTFSPENDTYTATSSWVASDEPVTGLTAGAGESLYIATKGRLYLWPDSSMPVWSSVILGTPIASPVALLETSEGLELFAGANYGVVGFQLGGGVEPASVSVNAAGSLDESTADEATLTWTRSGPTDSDLDVYFSLGGTATLDSDYTLFGATGTESGEWMVRIPAGSSEAAVTLNVVTDNLVEGNQTIHARLVAAPGYTVGEPAEATVEITDSLSEFGGRDAP